MLTDLRYALRQSQQALGKLSLPRETPTIAGRVEDHLQRAIDALERCIEAAADAEDRLDSLEAAGIDTGRPPDKYVKVGFGVELPADQVADADGFTSAERALLAVIDTDEYADLMKRRDNT